MNVPLPGVTVDPQGVSTSVAITDSNGNTPTVYSDRFGVNTVALPDTITTRTTFFLPGEGPWTITPTASGQVTKTTTLTLEDSQVATVTVGSVFDASQWEQFGTYVPVLTAGGHGCKCDGQIVVDGAMTAASGVLTSASGLFKGSDVGKTVFVAGAGTSGDTLQTTIASYQSATQVTLGANAVGTVSGVTVLWGTDDSTAWSNLLTAWYNQGGGDIFFSGVSIASQLVFPNDGGTTTANQGCAYQPPGRIFGTGPYFNGEWSPNLVKTGSVLALFGSAGPAKIDTRGSGSLELDHFTLWGVANPTNPLFQTTNTTIFLHHLGVVGDPSQTGTGCTQDAFILGGQTTTIGNTSTAPFQGYGSRLGPNYYDRIRHAVTFGTFANGVTVDDDTISSNCGSSEAQGAPYVFTPVSGQYVEGCNIRSSTVEVVNYPYVVNMVRYATRNVIEGVSAYDDSGTFKGLVYCADTSTTINNLVIEAWLNDAGGTIPALAGPAAQQNTLLTASPNLPVNLSGGYVGLGDTAKFIAKVSGAYGFWNSNLCLGGTSIWMGGGPTGSAPDWGAVQMLTYAGGPVLQSNQSLATLADRRLSLQSPAYAASFTPNPVSGEIIEMTLTGAVTVNAVASPATGQRMTFVWVQDATGGRTITYNAVYMTGGGAAIATTASTATIDNFVYDGNNWRLLSRITGQ